MKKSPFFILLMLFGFMSVTSFGQNRSNNTVRITTPDGLETYYSTPLYFDKSLPLRDLVKNAPAAAANKKRERDEVPNHVGPGYTPPGFTVDPVWQNWQNTNAAENTTSSAPIVNIDGVTNLDGVMPPDTQGDVGLNYYFQMINCHFAIYQKNGSATPVLGPSLLSVLFTGVGAPWEGTSDGDPIVLYDQGADRWLVSQFSLPNYPSSPFAMLVAISVTNDPTGSWYRYVYNFNGIMPDYPKFGVWSDGYYLSVNQFTGASGPAACVWQRSKMLTGDPTAGFIYKNCSTAGGVMIPSDWDGINAPVSGEPNHFTFISGANLKIYDFHTDWVTVANSTCALAYTLTPAAFNTNFCTDSREACIPQPGTSTKLETLSDRLMFRVQYRNFGSYQTLVTSHSVNVASLQSGCRWYELRSTGSGAGWDIYQQGTWEPDAPNRWMPSIAMNGSGDIALGYSVSDGTSTYPSIRYTGRRSTDALGTMTVPEQTIIAGTASQGGGSRWGDYAMMSVDPTDDLTFWFTSEYVQTAGSFNWKTRIASFKFSNNPVITTTDATAITPTTATLNGTINPNGLAATYHFEWGTTTSYGNSTTTVSAGSGTSAVPVSAPITGLTAGTTYHFRLTGVNSDGSTNGNDMSFTPGAAIVTTTAATAIAMTTATSGGNVVSDGGGAVSVRGVCWATTANPTTAGSHTTDGAGLGTFTSSLTGLTSNTLYHIRAYATNSYGTWYGSDLTFTSLCGIYTPPLTEAFTNTTIPSCWSQVDHQGNGMIWLFGVITNTGAPVLTGNYAYLNSRAYGAGNSQNADLITPVLDCSAFSTITLGFSHYFRSGGGGIGTLSYSSDGGSTWTTIQTWTTSSTNPATFSQPVTGAAGHAAVQFRWNYTATYGYWWAIDNISVTGTSANTLTVTPPNQNVPATPAGSTPFSVTCSTSWNAASNQTWCTVNPSGTGNGTITANYTVNTSASSRVATITVTASGAPTVTVTVTQAGATPTLSVTPPNQNVPDSPTGSTNFTVTSNADWTVVSDQTWCTVTPSGTGNGVITASYAQNLTTSSRVANITVTVATLSPITVTLTQAASAPMLSVTPPNQNVAYSPAASVDFTVTSNTSWTTSSNAAWCIVTPSSSSGNGTITASYSVNPDPAPRVATITITATGLSPVTVTVTQDFAAATLSVQPSNQNVPASPASNTSFGVTSNSSWSVVSDQGWCTVNPSGTGNGTITANYTENTSPSSRMANITVTVTGITPVVVTVTQAGINPTLTVSPPNQNVAYPAGNTSFSVSSNSSWTAVSDSSWLTVTPSGTGNGIIDAVFLQNPYYVSRVATITVTVAGIPAQMVTVSQAQSTVSVPELSGNSIRIIPNPANGVFRVDLGLLKYESVKVTVMDLSGKTILYKVCWEKPDLRFDLSGTPDGSYVVRVSTEAGEVTQKLILKH